MGKKYSPSGYQIINLGELNLSSSVTIGKGENADVDVLISLISDGKLGKKPLLLSFYETDDSVQLTGFGVIVGNVIELNSASLSANYHIDIYSDKIVITK